MSAKEISINRFDINLFCSDKIGLIYWSIPEKSKQGQLRIYFSGKKNINTRNFQKFQRKSAFNPGKFAKLCDTPQTQKFKKPKTKVKKVKNQDPWKLIFYYILRDINFLNFLNITLQQMPLSVSSCGQSGANFKA